MPKRKRPSQASGQAPGPSKNQRRKPRKPLVVTAAQKAAQEARDAASWLNPFD